ERGTPDDGAGQKIRPAAAESRAGAIRENSDDGVAHHVPQARNQQRETRQGGGDPQYLRGVEQQVDRGDRYIGRQRELARRPTQLGAIDSPGRGRSRAALERRAFAQSLYCADSSQRRGRLGHSLAAMKPPAMKKPPMGYTLLVRLRPDRVNCQCSSGVASVRWASTLSCAPTSRMGVFAASSKELPVWLKLAPPLSTPKAPAGCEYRTEKL